MKNTIPNVHSDNDINGGSHFIFQPFVTEKERIKKILEMNKYCTEPINLPVLHHDFRERDKSKEIQPKMKFSCRQEPTSSSGSSYNSSIITHNTNKNTSKKHLYLKSTYSMLLRLGSLRHFSTSGTNNDARLYDVLASELTKLDDNDHKTAEKAHRQSIYKNRKSLANPNMNSQKTASSNLLSKSNAGYEIGRAHV